MIHYSFYIFLLKSIQCPIVPTKGVTSFFLHFSTPKYWQIMSHYIQITSTPRYESPTEVSQQFLSNYSPKSEYSTPYTYKMLSNYSDESNFSFVENLLTC
ncbi:hypothetical protein C0J52_15114 [Blattella germanica]|nr:hypothetical protein C0J52_15114 [Blattella germanica]